MARTSVLAVTVIAAALLPVPLTRADTAADLAGVRQHQAQQRWAASESLATVVLTRLEAEHARDSLALSDALHLLGIARWKLAGYADGSGFAFASRSLGIRERRLGPDHLEVAAAHALLGRFLLGIERSDSALVHVRRAIDIRAAQLAPDDTLLADSWDQLALIHRDHRDYRSALDSWEHAIDIRKRAHGPEHPEVARLLAQTGVPWMELGDLERARQVLEESLAMFARTSGPDDRRRWIPLNILADVSGRRGDLAGNVDLLQEALRVVRNSQGENSREALTLRTNLAVALTTLGDFAGARAINTKLLPLVQAQYGATHPRTLTIRHGLAISSGATGDTATAMRQLNDIELALMSRGEASPRGLSAVLLQKAELLYHQGRDREARTLAERAIQAELANRQPSGVAMAGAEQIAILSLEATGDTAAMGHAARELARIAETYGVETASFAGSVPFHLALAARALGNRDEAWARALEAERLSRERLRFNLQSLPDRRALQLTRAELLPLELVVDLSRDGDRERLETAWDRLVRSRGMVRTEIARRRLSRDVESDTAVVAAHERWLAAQRHLARRLVSAGTTSIDSTARAALEALRWDSDDAEAVYARTLGRHGAQLAPAEVGIADVRSRLRPGEALVGCFETTGALDRWLHFAADTGYVVAFVARGGSDTIERIEIGPSPLLRAALDPWRERLATSPGPRARSDDQAERECRRLGRRARQLTWDRIAPHLAGAMDVFVVADGPLLDLPWQALPGGATRYLVETGPHVHLLNSERELVHAPTAPRSRSMLAVGSPDYDQDAADRRDVGKSVAAVMRAAPDPCATGGLPTLAALPGSGREADAVASVWRRGSGYEARVLSGAAANEQEFKRAARGRAVIHLATHGVVAGDTCVLAARGQRGVGGIEAIGMLSGHRPSSPALASSAQVRSRSPWLARRVWLALSGANHAREHSDENEGLLTAEEVLTLDLDGTDWVVLSACHSGLADAWSREGALGMRRAFGLAGARTVIASQWAVEDEAAREWMQALYAARGEGATNAAAALTAASRTTLAARRRAGRSTHPFYWAAFAATGE